MRVHKVGDRFGGKQHHAYGHDNRGGHDGNMLRQSHRRDDGIQRKNDVQHGNLNQYGRHGCGFQRRFFFLNPFQTAVDFVRCFSQQE